MHRMEQVTPMTLPEIYERIYRGSMPRLYENPDVDRAQYYESYLETYISRDIKDLSQVADETAFFNFMSVVAARMYFLDTGLCAHLTKWTSSATLEAGAMSGEFFETWVVSEIYKSYLNAGQNPPCIFTVTAVKDPDASMRGIKLATMQASGY